MRVVWRDDCCQLRTSTMQLYALISVMVGSRTRRGGPSPGACSVPSLISISTSATPRQLAMMNSPTVFVNSFLGAMPNMLGAIGVSYSIAAGGGGARCALRPCALPPADALALRLPLALRELDACAPAAPPALGLSSRLRFDGRSSLSLIGKGAVGSRSGGA